MKVHEQWWKGMKRQKERIQIQVENFFKSKVKDQGKSQRLRIHVDKEDFKSTTNYLQQEVGGGNERWV